jgi:hypothetical protein
LHKEIDKRLNYCPKELRKERKKVMGEERENVPEAKNFEMLTLIGLEWNVNEACARCTTLGRSKMRRIFQEISKTFIRVE